MGNKGETFPAVLAGSVSTDSKWRSSSLSLILVLYFQAVGMHMVIKIFDLKQGGIIQAYKNHRCALGLPFARQVFHSFLSLHPFKKSRSLLASHRERQMQIALVCR
jgi:hypothetical protein